MVNSDVCLHNPRCDCWQTYSLSVTLYRQTEWSLIELQAWVFSERIFRDYPLWEWMVRIGSTNSGYSVDTNMQSQIWLVFLLKEVFYFNVMHDKNITLPHLLGGSPYPGINARQIARKLQDGFRMPKPKHVDNKL